MMTDEAFEPFIRHLWPVGSEKIFVSHLEGPNYLSPNHEIMPDGFGDAAVAAQWDDARTIADLMCPHMEELEPFDPTIHDLDYLVEDVERFLPHLQKFTGRETPNFWPSS